MKQYYVNLTSIVSHCLVVLVCSDNDDGNIMKFILGKLLFNVNYIKKVDWVYLNLKRKPDNPLTK